MRNPLRVQRFFIFNVGYTKKTLNQSHQTNVHTEFGGDQTKFGTNISTSGIYINLE